MSAGVGGVSTPTSRSEGDAKDVPSGEQARRRKLTTAALVGIIGAAVALRMLGITWGLPGEGHLFSYHPDEFFSLQAAVNLLNRDPNPHFFNYPSLYLYLVAAACMVAHGVSTIGAGLEQFPDILRSFTLDARLVTVALSALTVWAVYAAASRVAGRRAGLLAAAVLAVAPGHVLYSHFAAVDVPVALFTTLSFLATLVLLDDARPKAAVLAGLAVGAAAATKYNGALALVMPLLALGIRLRCAPKPDRRAALKQALLVVVVAAVAFCICSPYVILDWQTAGGHIAFEREHMRVGEYPAKVAYPCGWFFHARALSYAVGGSAILLPLVGLSGVALRKRFAALLPLAVFGVLWYLMIGATGVRFARYGIPLIPLLGIGAGVGLAALSGGRWRVTSLVVAAVVCGMGLVSSALLSGSMSFHLDPRDAAYAAIEARVPRGREVGVGRTVWFDMPPLDVSNGGDALGRSVGRSFHDSPWELTGIFDAGQLSVKRPRWFVSSDFQTLEWLEAQDERALEFHATLEELYTPTHFSRPWGWLTLGPCGPLPHDWSYPFATVTVWELRQPEDSPPPRGN